MRACVCVLAKEIYLYNSAITRIVWLAACGTYTYISRRARSAFVSPCFFGEFAATAKKYMVGCALRFMGVFIYGLSEKELYITLYRYEARTLKQDVFTRYFIKCIYVLYIYRECVTPDRATTKAMCIVSS